MLVIETDSWFAELDNFLEIPFFNEGRLQPPMPAPRPQDLFDDG